MKLLAFGFLACVASFSSLRADEPNSDLKKSAGVWRMLAVIDNGIGRADERIHGMTVTIAGSVYTIRAGDRVVERGSFVLDASQNPRAIDATITEGVDKGKTVLGIYVVDSSTRKVCFAPPGKARPSRFEAPRGSGLALFISRREAMDDAAKHDLAQMQGEWQMRSLERNGIKLPDRLVATYKRTVTDSRYTVTWEEDGKREALRTVMTVHPLQNPKAVDVLLISGPFQGKTRLGIYRIDGDTETVCLAQPGKNRPTGFDSKQGALHVWDRVKK